jgi:hypothetical protein
MNLPDGAGRRRPGAHEGAIRERVARRGLRLVSVVLAGPRDLDEELICEWRGLEAGSVEDNAFLSPGFVLPALEHPAPSGDVFFASVHLPEDGASRLIGMAVFEKRRPRWRIPFPHRWRETSAPERGVESPRGGESRASGSEHAGRNMK